MGGVAEGEWRECPAVGHSCRSALGRWVTAESRAVGHAAWDVADSRVATQASKNRNLEQTVVRRGETAPCRSLANGGGFCPPCRAGEEALRSGAGGLLRTSHRVIPGVCLSPWCTNGVFHTAN